MTGWSQHDGKNSGCENNNGKLGNKLYDLNYFLFPLLMGDSENACFDRLRCYDYDFILNYNMHVDASEKGKNFSSGKRDYQRTAKYKKHLDIVPKGGQSGPYEAPMQEINGQSRWVDDNRPTYTGGIRLNRPLLEKFKLVNQPTWLAGIVGGIVNYFIFLLPIVIFVTVLLLLGAKNGVGSILTVYAFSSLFFAIGCLMHGYYPATNHFHDYSVSSEKNTFALLLTMMVCALITVLSIVSVGFYL